MSAKELADKIERILAEYHRAVELDDVSLLPKIMTKWCDLFFKPGASAILAALRQLPLTIPPEIVALSEKATRGEWRIREMGHDFFVERPKKKGEAYGVEILSDDTYATKRGDGELIVAAVNWLRSVIEGRKT